MTPQQIVGLAVRLFSIWLVTISLQIIGWGNGMSERLDVTPTIVPYVIAGLALLLAIVLWLFPMVVASKLIPRTRYDNVLRVPAQEAVTVACVIFALWFFLFRVLPSLAYYVSLIAIAVHSNHVITDYEQFHYSRLIPIAIELAVVLVLAFKPHAISRFLLSKETPHSDSDDAL